MNKTTIVKLAYRYAAMGTTGDYCDIEDLLQGDGVKASEHEVTAVCSKISDIYKKLSEKSDGWQIAKQD